MNTRRGRRTRPHSRFETERVSYPTSITIGRGEVWRVLATVCASQSPTSMQRGVTATLEANSQEVRNYGT